MTVMTADCLLIYAKGGGNGHLIRAVNLALKWQNNFESIAILGYATATKFLPSLNPKIEIHFTDWHSFLETIPDLKRFDLLVDTFGNGHKGEIEQAHIQKFNQAMLLARYNRVADHERFHLWYDEILEPYGKASEWDRELNSRRIGLIKKSNPCQINSERKTFAFVDPSLRVPLALVGKLSRLCHRKGWKFNYYPAFHQSIQGEKVCVIGAGYNTFYELFDQSDQIRFFPLKKKYDDQRKRVELYGKGLKNLNELITWISEK